jgi:L-alanine-DL-glutamate epimerase-like enolase superfamily enzyme
VIPCARLSEAGVISELITAGTASAYTIPTDAPEADGTFAWGSTTLIVVEIEAGGVRGLGYTYSDPVAASLAQSLLEKLRGESAWDIPRLFSKLRRAQRNYGREGVAATALSAIDVALWDLKCKLLQQPLVRVLGAMREAAPVYGSGGFTSYSDEQLTEQLGGWAAAGIPRVKMKVGTHPDDDMRRVQVARAAIGADTELFVDANGAYTQKQALSFARKFREEVNVREQGPPGMEIAAGEYGWTAMYFERMLAAQSVDVLQADASRCGGVTGFMDAAALADAQPLPFSAHCAPSLHMHLACAARPLRHVEYFHDHVRIESMLFDGFCAQNKGTMTPDLSRPGLGLVFKQADAERFRIKI